MKRCHSARLFATVVWVAAGTQLQELLESRNASDWLSLVQLPVSDEITALAPRVSREAADKAADNINAMIQQEQAFLDKKTLQCRMLEDQYTTKLRKATEAIRDIAADINFQRSFLNEAAAGQAEQEEEAFRELQSEVHFNTKACKGEEARLHLQHIRYQRDDLNLKHMKKVTSSLCPMSLIQESVGPCRQASAALARHKLRLAQRRGFVDGIPSRHMRTVLLQVAAALRPGHKHMKHRRHRSHLRAKSHQERQLHGKFASSLLMHRQEPAAEDSVEKSGAAGPSCSINSGSCKRVNAIMGSAYGQITENIARSRTEASDLAESCKDTEEFAKNEMQHASVARSDLGSKLSFASAQLGLLMERSEQRDEERRQMEQELIAAKAQCQMDLHHIEHDKICGLKTVRDRLQLAARNQELPEDCKVTDWVDGECSKPCGGGSKMLTRTVILPAKGGVECPPLQLVQPCEEHECEVDCQISEWSNWGSCSAECDGGMQERTRGVLQQENAGGSPCPELVDTRMCNSEACSRDCRLADWTEWTGCSEACNEGMQQRVRTVADAPVGDGSCPTQDAESRLETLTCNTQACESDLAARCTGQPVDVSILYDQGSDLERIPKSATHLLKLLRYIHIPLMRDADGTAAIGYAGFGNDLVAANEIIVPEADGSWPDAAFSSISKLALKTGPAYLAPALFWSEDQFRAHGRRDAVSTVIVVTGGNIADPYDAQEAAKQLHGFGVRVIVVVLEPGEREENDVSIRWPWQNIASTPMSQNVVFLPGADWLNENAMTAGEGIARRICSEVVVPS